MRDRKWQRGCQGPGGGNEELLVMLAEFQSHQARRALCRDGGGSSTTISAKDWVPLTGHLKIVKVLHFIV